MKKRNLLMGIVFICAVLNIVLSRVMDNFLPIYTLILTIPFYLIIIIFYRKTKLITIFCVLTILSQFGHYMLLFYSPFFEFSSPLMRVFGSFSFFFGIIGFFVAFALVLQHKTYKFTEISFLSFAIINYVFFSYFNFYFQNLLVRIFGPYEVHIVKMFYVYYGVVLAIEIGVAILQVIVIYFLERNKWYELRIMLKNEESAPKPLYE